MIDLLKYLISQIVAHPSDLDIQESSLSENMFNYNIIIHKDDIGKVIGKEGKIIQAIRNVAKVLAIKENKQVRIEIAETA